MIWTLYIILIITCAFVAWLIAKAIYAPFKKRHDQKMWNAWKEQNVVLKPGYWR